MDLFQICSALGLLGKVSADGGGDEVEHAAGLLTAGFDDRQQGLRETGGNAAGCSSVIDGCNSDMAMKSPFRPWREEQFSDTVTPKCE